MKPQFLAAEGHLSTHTHTRILLPPPLLSANARRAASLPPPSRSRSGRCPAGRGHSRPRLRSRPGPAPPPAAGAEGREGGAGAVPPHVAAGQAGAHGVRVRRRVRGGAAPPPPPRRAPSPPIKRLRPCLRLLLLCPGRGGAAAHGAEVCGSGAAACGRRYVTAGLGRGHGASRRPGRRRRSPVGSGASPVPPLPPCPPAAGRAGGRREGREGEAAAAAAAAAARGLPTDVRARSRRALPGREARGRVLGSSAGGREPAGMGGRLSGGGWARPSRRPLRRCLFPPPPQKPRGARVLNRRPRV